MNSRLWGSRNIPGLRPSMLPTDDPFASIPLESIDWRSPAVHPRAVRIEANDADQQTDKQQDNATHSGRTQTPEHRRTHRIIYSDSLTFLHGRLTTRLILILE